MLLVKNFRRVKKLSRTKTTLINPLVGYSRPRIDFQTSTTIWHVDEMIKRRVRDWMRLMGEDGYSGVRESVARKDLTIYTGTYSVFPVPLMEWILIRYGGKDGNKILDAFAGGPPRGLASGIMGYEYHGFDISKKQIKANKAFCKRLEVPNTTYHVGDARDVGQCGLKFGAAVTCPPYYNIEVYSDDERDFSNLPTYNDFNKAMRKVAKAHRPVMKVGSFVCIIVGNFRDKKTKELIDFRSDTVKNFKDAGFIFHQDVILCKNFGSAAKRAANAWRGHKLVPRHEHLLVFQTPKLLNKNKGRVKL